MRKSSSIKVDGVFGTHKAGQAKYFKHPWRKNQLSDHFPIWFELIIDSSGAFLAEKLRAIKAAARGSLRSF